MVITLLSLLCNHIERIVSALFFKWGGAKKFLNKIQKVGAEQLL